jgi:hypothetical protein
MRFSETIKSPCIFRDDFELRVPIDPGEFFWTSYQILVTMNVVAVPSAQAPPVWEPFGFVEMENETGLSSDDVASPMPLSEELSQPNPLGVPTTNFWRFLLDLLTDPTMTSVRRNLICQRGRYYRILRILLDRSSLDLSCFQGYSLDGRRRRISVCGRRGSSEYVGRS